jgi:peptidoglycan/xylan/chitin deacetylase (PgdA/CDA1 family)
MRKARLARLLATTGVLGTLSLVDRMSGVLVLNYHRIGNVSNSAFDRGLWSADTDAFDDQVQYLKSHSEIITPADLPDVLDKRSGRYALITFDDGYADNYTAAYPVLRRHGVPATFFVATGFLDHPRLSWWDEIAWMIRTSPAARIEVRPWLSDPVVFDEPDREEAVRTLLRAYKTMPAEATAQYMDALAEATGSGRADQSAANGLWMTWDMVREMRSTGMTIGGHTVNHPVLAQLPRERQELEIAHCARRLAEELGEPMRYFSYPVGYRASFTDDTREFLRASGVRFAFSYYGGYRRFDDWDDYDIRRVAVETYITPDWFKAIVSLPRFFA